jgi:hypothetical protein
MSSSGESAPSPSPFFRLDGGIAALATGILLILGHLSNLGGPPGVGTVTGKTLVMAGHAVMVLALVGIHAKQHKAAGFLGWVGTWLAVLGTVAVSAVVFVEIARASGVPVEPVFEARAAHGIFAAGPIVFALGMFLLGAAVARALVFPLYGGVLLIAGTIVVAIGTLSGPVEPYLSLMGAVLTGIGFVILGAKLLAP